jgi:hypothetical protein
VGDDERLVDHVMRHREQGDDGGNGGEGCEREHFYLQTARVMSSDR